MAKQKITEYTEEVLREFLPENGLMLYDCEYVKEGRDRFLRVYIDKVQTGDEEEYISTDDCELVSRYLSDRLDADDPVEENYYLEVSSPGMDRKLTKPEHFERFIGKQIDVKLYRGVDGRKEFTGTLAATTDGQITIETEDGREYVFTADHVAKASLAVVF